MKPSKYLTRFLKEWYDWATQQSHTEDGPVFDRSFGLCATLRMWRRAKGEHYDPFGEMEDELRSLFISTGLDPKYPFGYDRFMADVCREAMHLDRNRLDWVLARIESVEEE